MMRTDVSPQASWSYTGRTLGASAMEPFFVFFLLPVAFGILAELLLRDTKHASLLAGIVSTLVVYLSLEVRDPSGTWNWLATLLIAPLVIAFALTAVFVCYGRMHDRKRRLNGA